MLCCCPDHSPCGKYISLTRKLSFSSVRISLSGPCLEAPRVEKKCFVPFGNFLPPSDHKSVKAERGVWGQRGSLLLEGKSPERLLVPKPKGCSICPVFCVLYKGQSLQTPLQTLDMHHCTQPRTLFSGPERSPEHLEFA